MRNHCTGSLIAFAALMFVAVPPTTAATGSCNRSCLEAVAEAYLAAMVKHDPASAPLAKHVRYTENAVELTLPDGLWRTVEGIGAYRLYVADPQQGEIGFFVTARENATPVLVATRLKVDRRRIVEIESYAPRLGGGPNGTPGSGSAESMLGDVSRVQFRTALPPEQRLTRARLADIADSYYTGLENNRGDHVPPFADDCLRLENGMQMSGRPLPPGTAPNSLTLGCRAAFAAGYYREDTRLRNRRILAIDEERGLVYAACFFDHDATVRSYVLKDGRENVVKNTAPWTWGLHEIFQIDAAGRISQVEAVLIAVPYGMRPGWTTGAHRASPQARHDGFQEY